MQANSTGIDVEYFFSSISSFAYIGHAAFQDMANRLNLKVTYRPMQLGKVFAASGGLGLADRHPARSRNRLLELQRWRDARGLEMNIQPKFFPTNPALADCVVIALQEADKNPASFMTAVMRKVWVEEANIAEETVIADCLAACGEDADQILQMAKSDGISALYDANSERGIEKDVIGSPCVLYQGEPFWGQDRFEQVEAAITSGRAPYSANI